MTSAGSAVRFERDREPLDHVGAVTRDGSVGDRLHRAEVRAGVVFGDDDDERRDDEADHRAAEQSA